MAKLVQMMALTFFTVNSTVNGAILHGDDRENADVQARYPQVSEEDAKRLEREGLAKRHDGKVPDSNSDDGTGLSLGERAGVMMENVTDADNSVDAPTGMDTRMTTTFERPIEELAGAGGADRSVLTATDASEAPAAEDDAPASSRKTARAAK